MAFSLDAFDAQYGTSTQHAKGNTQWNSGTVKAAPKPGSNFFPNALKTITTVPGQVAGAIGSSIAKGFHDVAGGASEALTAGTQNNANEAYRQSIEAAGKRYHELYASGKLSKAAYTKLSKDLINQSQSLSSDINGQVAEMVTPKDFATGLATVGSLPFAAGTLTGVEGAAAAGGALGVAAKAARVIGVGKEASLPVAAAKSLIKYPLVTQPVAQAPVNLAVDLKHGDTGKAAMDAALLAAPAALTGAAKVGKVLAPILKDAAYGKSAVLTDAFGVSKVKSFIDANPKKAALLKQMEQFTLDQPAVKNKTESAGEWLASYLKDTVKVDPAKASMDEILAGFDKYSQNVVRLNRGIAAGIAPKGSVITADFREVLPTITAKLKALGDNPSLPAKMEAVNSSLDKAGIQNHTIRTQLNSLVENLQNPEALSDFVNQQIVRHTPELKLDKGFVVTQGPREQAYLPTLKEAKKLGDVKIGTKALPGIGTIAKGAEKLGVGFKDYNTKQIGIARDTFVKGFNKLGIEGRDGKTVYEDLSQLAEDHHLGDLRQLHGSEIQQKLSVSPSNARAILREAKKMYDSVPLSQRGLAGKVQDANLKFNPLAPGYARIQGKLRYDLNPAFRAQQRIEAATLGQVATGGHAITGDVSKTVELMREQKFLPGAEKGYTAEALKDDSNLTNITTRLTNSEEKSLARVLEATAKKNGTTVKDELANEDTRRLMRAIVMNPKQGVLSSNFAKAANLLFFPSAYNAKVTGIALKALASQPPAVQFGVIKGINDFHEWSKTDAGIKWKSDNSEVLGLLNYFTPINSVEQTMGFLGSGDVRKLGLIGGLPFGVITRVLEGQGITPKSNPPYLDPKTGELVPDKIPVSLKARAQLALKDVIDTMFTFPGRQAGLGSKTDLINTITSNAIKPKPGEVKLNDRSSELTAANKNTQRVLGAKPTSPKTMPTPAVPRTLNLAKPQIVPIYKSGSTKARRGKTLAKKPGTF